MSAWVWVDGRVEEASAPVVPADDGGLTKPKAFVVVRPDHRAQVADAAGRDQLVAALQAHVRDHLSKHKYPRWIEVVDELPRNDRGKVDKQALIAASAGTPA